MPGLCEYRSIAAIPPYVLGESMRFMQSDENRETPPPWFTYGTLADR